MAIKVAIGISDFRRLRREGYYYVDKSLFIRDVLDHPQDVLLFTRPRRFGKTLNLSMLRTFLEKSSHDVAPLFAGLRIFEPEGGDARGRFQRHPVISISFRGVAAMRAEECLRGIAGVLRGAYEDHLDLLKEGALEPHEEESFRGVLAERLAPAQSWRALLDLSRYLHRRHGERVLLLIDDYDTPLISGYTHGYGEEISLHLRNLFSAVLEDNEHLYKAVLMGVLGVSGCGLLSGLVHSAACSILEEEFAASFGFTEAEVDALLIRAGLSQALEEVRSFYNGHDFGWQAIYNPWSVLSYAGRPEPGCQVHWNLCSGEDLLRHVLMRRGPEILAELKVLHEGGVVQKQISGSIVLRDLSADAIFSLLLFSGYLKCEELGIKDGRRTAKLRVPNREIGLLFEDALLPWASGQTSESPRDLRWAPEPAGLVEVGGGSHGSAASRGDGNAPRSEQT